MGWFRGDKNSMEKNLIQLVVGVSSTPKIFQSREKHQRQRRRLDLGLQLPSKRQTKIH